MIAFLGIEARTHSKRVGAATGGIENTLSIHFYPFIFDIGAKQTLDSTFIVQSENGTTLPFRRPLYANGWGGRLIA